MKIKFGIIGCGNIGRRHAKHISEHKEGILSGVFDTNTSRAKYVSDKYSCRVFKSYSELLDSEIDIVNICTPNGLHKDHSIEALNKNKNVLVEKPMALNLEDCEKMIHCALSKNKQLFVVKQNRYNPPVVAVKKSINKNELGKIYCVVVNCFWNRNNDYYINSDWKGSKTLDGGTLYTQFSHFVDILYYLFGDIYNISGQTKNTSHENLIEFEDTGVFSFRLKNGGLGSFNFTTSAYDKNMEGSITIFSEKGTLKIGGQYLNTLEYIESSSLNLNVKNENNSPNDYGTYQGSMSNHDKVINNVINTLNGRDTIMTNAMEGMKVVEIIERLYKSTSLT